VRCLIVDDSATFTNAASGILEGAGIHVVGLASTAAEAVERYRRLRPDVTLVDVNLGADNGFDVVTMLSHEDTPRPAMILVSTHSEHDFEDLMAESPALGFVPKIALSGTAIRNLLATTERPRANRDTR
jgi:DNA-binding NarL/FixJ family response regulator